MTRSETDRYLDASAFAAGGFVGVQVDRERRKKISDRIRSLCVALTDSTVFEKMNIFREIEMLEVDYVSGYPGDQP